MQLYQLFTGCRQNKDQTVRKQNIVYSKTIFSLHMRSPLSKSSDR